MNNRHCYFFSGKFLQRITQGFHRTVHITFDNKIELLEVTQCQAAADLIQRDMLFGTDALLAQYLRPAVGYFFSLTLIGKYFEFLSSLRCAAQSQYLYGRRGTCFIKALVALIEHGFGTPVILPAHHYITLVQRTILHKHGSYIAASFIQRSFYNGTNSFFFRISLQLKQLSLKQYLFQQHIYIQPALGRDLLALVFTTPVFYQQVHSCKLFFYFFRICSFFINFINGEHHRQVCRLSMADGLTGLRHHRIICRDHDNSHIRRFGATRTHGRKRLVTRSIEESQLFA